MFHSLVIEKKIPAGAHTTHGSWYNTQLSPSLPPTSPIGRVWCVALIRSSMPTLRRGFFLTFFLLYSTRIMFYSTRIMLVNEVALPKRSMFSPHFLFALARIFEDDSPRARTTLLTPTAIVCRQVISLLRSTLSSNTCTDDEITTGVRERDFY